MLHVIDEATARTAWDGIHMSDYVPGQATAEWQGMCAECDEAADAALKRAPERADEIEGIRTRYHNRAADYINERNRIDAMCPSVLITGPANFPTRKKQKQNDRMDSFYKKDWGFDKLINKLRIIGTDRESIKSNDADAIDKLRKKLADREADQAAMKAANAYYRKHKTMDGFEPADVRKAAQDNLDFECQWRNFPDDAARDAYLLKTRPFAPYQLSNNNAEIRRIKQRIETLEKEKERAAQGNVEYDVTICDTPCHVIENADDMRLQLFFDGKPDEDTRQAVKRNGFRWARSIGAWQRQLTNNARYTLRNISERVTIDEADEEPNDDTATVTSDEEPATDATTSTDANDANDRMATIAEWMEASTKSGEQLDLEMYLNFAYAVA